VTFLILVIMEVENIPWLCDVVWPWKMTLGGRGKSWNFCNRMIIVLGV